MSNVLMSESQMLFFELLLVCTGAKNSLSRLYTEEQWNEALVMAQEQSVEGVLLSAIERLKANENLNVNDNRNHNGSFEIPKMVLLQWIGSVQILEANSKKIAEASETVIKYFRENGYACNILKGSAVARYYPQPERRQSGDVDVWVDGGRKKIYDFARKFDKDGKLYGVNYHHIHFHLIEDVHIEVHVWPSYLSSPLRNYRLHKFCNLHRPSMETDKPSLAFDRVFILLHAYQHFCGHGIGLRQIMDYYYVLKRSFEDNLNDNHNLNHNDNLNKFEESVYWIKKLGMERFARGMMWVLKVYFGLEEQYLLLEPDEKEGRFLMQEVMLTGNMGHSDTRNWGSMKSPLSRFFFNLKRDLYLVRHCPHEALWQPFFSIWLYAWRWSKGLLNDSD